MGKVEPATPGVIRGMLLNIGTTIPHPQEPLARNRTERRTPTVKPRIHGKISRDRARESPQLVHDDRFHSQKPTTSRRRCRLFQKAPSAGLHSKYECEERTATGARSPPHTVGVLEKLRRGNRLADRCKTIVKNHPAN